MPLVIRPDARGYQHEFHVTLVLVVLFQQRFHRRRHNYFSNCDGEWTSCGWTAKSIEKSQSARTIQSLKCPVCWRVYALAVCIIQFPGLSWVNFVILGRERRDEDGKRGGRGTNGFSLVVTLMRGWSCIGYLRQAIAESYLIFEGWSQVSKLFFIRFFTKPSGKSLFLEIQ